MPLLPMSVLLNKANAEGYAVGAFNTNNMEITQAIIEGAVAERAPVIIQCSEGAMKYAGVDTVVAMVKALAENVDIPVALHLDHGKEFDNIIKCIRAGFTSVMIDASHFPLEENIAMTKKVVEIAHAAGVSVEAELGRIAGVEDNVSTSERDAMLTDPDEAERFVSETGVDALAIAIGTAHGPRKFKGEPKLEMDLIREIKSRVNIPLVMHGASAVPKEVIDKAVRYGAEIEGASGVPDEAVSQAVANGINKVNIDTDMRLAMIAAMREVLHNNPKATDPRKVLGPAKDAIVEIVRHKISILGSGAKA